MAERLPAPHFDAIYELDPDPWRYRSSAYEREKYERTLDALPMRPVGRALEMGCSIGVFTTWLAERCRALLAVDFSSRAVRGARSRTRDLKHVRVEQRDLPGDFPTGPFDLIVCSEVLYYWTAEEVLEGLRRIEAALAPGGSFIAVHWTGTDPDAPLDGERVHALLHEHTALRHSLLRIGSTYLLERWERPL